MALVKNFFAGIGFVTLLLVMGVSAWIFRDDIEAWVNRRNEIVMSEPSPRLAIVAEEKIQQMLDGEGARETRLSEAEIQSYLQYRAVDLLPAGVNNLAIDIRDSTISVSAGLDFTVLDIGDAAVENVRRVMGDSALITSELFPSVVGPGRGRVDVLSLQAGLIPVPPMLIGMAIQQLGWPTDGQAVLFDIPLDVVEFRIENEEIVLVRDR